jgi:hypothetical protein
VAGDPTGHLRDVGHQGGPAARVEIGAEDQPERRRLGTRQSGAKYRDDFVQADVVKSPWRRALRRVGP